MLKMSGRQMSTEDVTARINRGLKQEWGGAKSKRFQDGAGGGWVVDLSDAFGNELLTAVVRSGPGGGTRQIVAVLEGDEVERLLKTNSLPVIEGMEDAEAIAATPARAPARPATKPPDPNRKVMVVVRQDDNPEVVARLFVVTEAEMSENVATLLSEGVPADQIEIWSEMRKPKVKIAFE
jgi:hypothetical protein